MAIGKDLWSSSSTARRIATLDIDHDISLSQKQAMQRPRRSSKEIE
jgi:hypothetical protein